MNMVLFSVERFERNTALLLRLLLTRYSWIIVSVFVIIIVTHMTYRHTKDNEFRVFKLTIRDLKSGQWVTAGFYPIERQAEEAGNCIVSEDHAFKYGIDAVKVYTYKGRDRNIYMFTGWNDDKNGNETDIWIRYYYTKNELLDELAHAIVRDVARDRWTVSRYEVGKSYWSRPEQKQI